jgi:hypothetical protein
VNERPFWYLAFFNEIGTVEFAGTGGAVRMVPD